LFGTPHGLDLAAVARAHGIEVVEVQVPGELPPAIHESVAGGGVRVILVRTDRAANVVRHREVWAAVHAALGV
jgi:2-succinyl-5-enolpyruvyl-6-hydroxy-3-cyclohexene-1-carboxylate synthase